MTSQQAINLLRFACAAIWTELEKDEPSLEDCQTIANEALRLTDEFAPKGKSPGNETGMESWREYLARAESLPSPAAER